MKGGFDDEIQKNFDMHVLIAILVATIAFHGAYFVMVRVITKARKTVKNVNKEHKD